MGCLLILLTFTSFQINQLSSTTTPILYTSHAQFFLYSHYMVYSNNEMA